MSKVIGWLGVIEAQLGSADAQRAERDARGGAQLRGNPIGVHRSRLVCHNEGARQQGALLRIAFVWATPLLLGLAVPDEEWRHVIPNESQFEYDCDTARSLSSLASGDVVVGGDRTTEEWGSEPVVLRIDRSTGLEQWAALPGSSPGDALATDGTSTVFAAGLTQFYDGFAVTALDAATGESLWGYRDYANGSEAYAIAYGRDSRVAAGGMRYSFDGAEVHYDFAVVLLPKNIDVPVWTANVNGTSGGGVAGLAVWQEVNSLAFDSEGNVVAAGRLLNEETSFDLSVVKLASNGTELWRRSIDGPGAESYTCPGCPFGGLYPDNARAVAVDPNDDVFVAGAITVDAAGEPEFALFAAKLSGVDGSELWRLVIAPGSARSIALDDSGGLFVAGRVSDHAFVARVDPETGQTTWSKEIAPGEARDLALADDAQLVVAVRGAAGEFIVSGIAAENGEEEWHKEIRGNGSCLGGAETVVTDADGVVAAGAIGRDFAVVALDPLGVPEPGGLIGAIVGVAALAQLSRGGVTAGRE